MRKQNVLLSALAVYSLGLLSEIQTSASFAQQDYSTVYNLSYPSINNKITKKPSKVSNVLQQKIAKMSQLKATDGYSKALSSSELSEPLVKVDMHGRIQTYVYFDSITDNARELIAANDGIIEAAVEKWGIIQAWIPFDRIEPLSAVPLVKEITAPGYSFKRAGSVTTQGDSILKAAQLRSLGYTGIGIKVGVISDSADQRATAIASGDLPTNITIVGPNAVGTDEGTAMMEIVYDLAPGAQLGFCGPGTSAEMSECIDLLAGSSFGADVIVDDLGWLDQPFFQDGFVAQSAGDVVNRGVVYISAFGNSAEDHHRAEFQETSSLTSLLTSQLGFNPGPEHNFGLALGGANDPTLDFGPIPPGRSFRIVLQWNEPFLQGQIQSDYDLYILDSNNNIVAWSNTINTTRPYEIVGLTNQTGTTANYKMVITKYSGARRILKVFLFGYGSLNQHLVREGSAFGHPCVDGVIAAGAVPSANPSSIESFSSRGPCEIYFPNSETRQKPDMVATDGVSVTGAGGFPSPFYGTSAAAPHVAGVAALLKGAYSSASDVVDALKNGAIDLGTAGDDTIYGAGRVDALASSQVLANSNRDSIGVYRGSPGWFLDRNKNGQWSGCSFDKCGGIWGPGALPVVGDWNGNGITDIGVFYSSSGRWDLDVSANFMWDGCSVDSCTDFGTIGDLPVVGDWNANGISKIGVFRPSTGRWYLDTNGNRQWDGCGVDACVGPFGMASDLPVAGDWTGNGIDRIGVFRPSTGKWYLDLNNNRQWDGCSVDGCATFGTNGDLPVVGDWNGDGIAEIGVFRPSKGKFYLDLNGNRGWEPAVDGVVGYGINGDRPVTGKW